MKNNLRKLTLITIFIIGVIATATSQVTTSGISGRITDGKDPLPGATVVAVHVPSGTKYGSITNNEGRFSIQGMRPGDPYTVEVSFIGYNKATLTGISLPLGETYILNSSLKESSSQVGEVVVVGAKTSVYNSERNGVSLNVNNRQISAMPTISRSINDVTKLTPQASGNQIGGGNSRQNYITVDGAQFNNAFGIGGNLPAGGSPISLDALDQISVNITPFDVRQSGFIGASVNAVTRSGGNEFTGSAYSYFQNQDFKGDKVGDASFVKNPSKDNLYGFRLGGPIIKNKLFFFVNYEESKSIVPGPSRVAATATQPANYPNGIARPTESEMNTISKYLMDTYGYETGPYQGYSNESPNRKMLARIDWNINQNHKFNFRYSDTKAKTPNIPTTSFSPFSSIYTGNRQAMDAIWFKNSGYFQETNFSSFSAELNSILGSGKFANTLRYTYSFQNEPRSTEGKTFPYVDILKDDKVFTSFGTELFTYGNLREVKTTTITDDFTWRWKNNNFTFGVQYENNNTKNGFMRFGSSYYVFKSWDDFVNGAKPQNFGVTFSNTPGYQQDFPSFNFNQFSAYIQDEIIVNPKLKLTGGVRADLPTYSQPAEAHPLISKMSFGGQKYNSAMLPKSEILWSPRMGFNYDIKGDRSLVVRGGTGIFTGRVPFVWIVGQVGDAGMLQTTQTYTGATVPGPFKPEISAYYPAKQPVAGELVNGTFTVISEDFKLPQSWKSSLALDAKLPWGLRGTIEGLYNKDFNAAFFVNEGIKGQLPTNVSGYADNRLIYPSKVTDKYYEFHTKGVYPATAGKEEGLSPIVLENRKGGYYYSITAKLEKSFEKGFYGMIAYTHSDARNLVDGFGDQASSAWNGNPNVNGANSVEKSYAGYVIPDKIISNISYKFEYLKFMATTISIFYEGGIQGRFSYVYSKNIARDGAGAYNLIYVPKNPTEITFVDQKVNNVNWTAQDQSTAFFNYIKQDKYLSSRQGQYAERNGAKLPWRNQFDLKIMQDFFIKAGGKKNTIQVSLDIQNVGNLLNKNWGIAQNYTQNNILSPVNHDKIVPGGTIVPTYQLNPYNNEMLKNSYRDVLGYMSTYSMQLGVRYIFN